MSILEDLHVSSFLNRKRYIWKDHWLTYHHQQKQLQQHVQQHDNATTTATSTDTTTDITNNDNISNMKWY